MSNLYNCPETWEMIAILTSDWGGDRIRNHSPELRLVDIAGDLQCVYDGRQLQADQLTDVVGVSVDRDLRIIQRSIALIRWQNMQST